MQITSSSMIMQEAKDSDVCQPFQEREMVQDSERFDAINQRRYFLCGKEMHLKVVIVLLKSVIQNVYHFYTLQKGYSLFINSFYRIRADIGRVTGAYFESPNSRTQSRYLCFYGKRLRKHGGIALTGKPLLPPACALNRGWRGIFGLDRRTM